MKLLKIRFLSFWRKILGNCNFFQNFSPVDVMISKIQSDPSFGYGCFFNFFRPQIHNLGWRRARIAVRQSLEFEFMSKNFSPSVCQSLKFESMSKKLQSVSPSVIWIFFSKPSPGSGLVYISFFTFVLLHLCIFKIWILLCKYCTI